MINILTSNFIIYMLVSKRLSYNLSNTMFKERRYN